MLSFAAQTSLLTQNTYLGPALVLDIDKYEGKVLLKLENNSLSESELWAKSALTINHEFHLGENVLVVGEDINKLYIIGLLDNKVKIKTKENVLTIKDGTNAKIEEGLDNEKLQIKSKSGELIFEYNANSGKSSVNIPSGDLEFVTANGNINFVSEGDINIQSKRSVQVNSNQEISLQTSNNIGTNPSELSLKNNKVKIISADVDISSQRSQFQIDEAKYIGKEFQGRIKNVKLILGKLESLANTVIQKAENIYQSVKGLTQFKTGRMRTLVDSTFHLKGEKVFMKAEEDFKVKAEKIHLG